MKDGQCFICKSWMDEDQLVKGNDGFFRCYEHAYLNQETLIAALREAGEKMARALQDVLHDRPSAHTDGVWGNINSALEAWEDANK